jgi:Fur family peroxide stress response transcriptional regulator
MQKRGQDDPLAGFLEKCKKYKLRVTPQRIAIYREISKSEKHPSAELIHRSVRKLFPHISFDTVNRTLLTFVEIGLVDGVEGYGSPRRYDPKLEPHHHLYCIKCGEIIDFCCEEFDDLKLLQALPRGFTVLGKKVVIKGVCSSCSK